LRSSWSTGEENRAEVNGDNRSSRNIAAARHRREELHLCQGRSRDECVPAKTTFRPSATHHTKALVLVSPTARMPQEPSSEPETHVISRVKCNYQTKDHYKIHYVVYFHIWTTSVRATCDSKVDATTSSTDTYRPLRPGGGRILTGVQQLLCGVFERTAVQHVTPPFTMLHHLNQGPEHVRYATVSGAVHVWHAIRCRDSSCEA